MSVELPNHDAAPGKPSARGGRPRHGGCLQGLILLTLFAAIGLFAWFGLTNPWIFTVGRTRYVPIWQGTGEAEGPGGRYRLFVAFYPTGTSTARASTWAKGYGWVCAPGGHRYSVHVDAATDSVVWKNMNGQPFHLYTHGSSTFAKLNRGEMGPPVIDLRGKWVGDTLAMSDGGSITGAFNPDGSLADPVRPGGPARAITLSEKVWGVSDPC